MEAKLLASLETHIAGHPSLKLIPAEQADQMRRQIASIFGFSESAIWWWQCRGDACVSKHYDENDDFRTLTSVLPQGDVPLFLFATDDEAPPWPCVQGRLADLLSMLRDIRFFEYFIVDEEQSLITFDNHHNTILKFGRPLGS